MSLYKVGDIWYAYICVKGRPRIRESTGTSDRADAQRYHDERKAEIWKAPKPRSVEKTFGDAITAWLRVKQRSANDARNVAYILADNDGKDRIGRMTPLSMVTRDLFDEHFGMKSPGTYNRYLSVVNAALSIAVANGWLAKLPGIRKRAEPDPVDRHLSGEQWVALFNELPEHQKPMAVFALETGLRRSNVLLLEWREVNLQNATVSFEAGKMKGRKAHVVPLNENALAILNEQIGKHPVFVFTYKGEPIQDIKTGFGKARDRAGLHGFRWHDLRHTWASWHVMNGTPEFVLKALGAWRSDQHQRYLHLAKSFVAQYAGNTKPVDLTPRKKAA